MKLSDRMKRALVHIRFADSQCLAVGNYRLQQPASYVPSNTFNALHDRGLVGYFWRGSDRHQHKMAFVTDEGKAYMKKEMQP